MGCWAGAAETEEVGRASGGVGDVILVIWAVEIYAIPASTSNVNKSRYFVTGRFYVG